MNIAGLVRVIKPSERMTPDKQSRQLELIKVAVDTSSLSSSSRRHGGVADVAFSEQRILQRDGYETRLTVRSLSLQEFSSSILRC